MSSGADKKFLRWILFEGESFLRFGSEVETDGHKSKCVICKVRIYSPDGAEGKARAISDR